MIFQQGKNIPLNQNPGTLPNMSGALDGWIVKLIFIQITKTIVNFKTIETETIINFEGVWEGVPLRELVLKPEGQRSWKWYNVWAKVNIGLVPDDKISFLGTKYRVMSSNDYALYGYHYYELVEDFT